jgi:arginine exporter protein ArgO
MSSGFKFTLAGIATVLIVVGATVLMEPSPAPVVLERILGLLFLITWFGVVGKVWNMAERSKKQLAEAKKQTELLESIVAKLHAQEQP